MILFMLIKANLKFSIIYISNIFNYFEQGMA